ncbi:MULTISPECIES: two-component system response regulator DcuR [unclassified Symbiopectobacterium]|uniref:two-component system response regulator DcuR n=1 Tax=unclassified Symbiopectobacterium TaxID=2794573 RepID=UPI0022266D4A|nr:MULTISPECIES: two-component system response regulator DcuR [unclassified Symbiopectobacterium]MCW2476483.1 two-component system response regulator DcuR [Candidatus Symbiopectobacterium sp. NZEC151]MCW2478560.1 two-component system response regulator DcuR [Candidatus Symbiopectobacterium sp. NZEC135]MCW2487853.1 two-component system response regulator DcuR [Candidatus Symbiopectobacterium sp. NZEC127]
MINVLIVDDDAMVAELNRSYLSQVPGFNCYATVPTLQQARNLLMQPDSEIDLVLLDIYMQQDNGLDLLPTIREFSEQTDVIIISSASDVYTIKKALHYGVVDYLIKPFQFSRFEQALTAYREEANLLKHREFVAQSDIDSLIRRTSGGVAGERKKLPKGLTSLTLRTVCEWIEGNQGAEFSTEMLANAIGISRVSCRKYLIYLADTNILATNILYGSTGRPVYLYRLLPEKQDALRQYCE